MMKKKTESTGEKQGLLRNFSVSKVIQAIVMSLCVSLMLAVFTPLDIALNNQREFVLDYSYFAKAMILPAAVIFVSILAVSLISLMINETAFKFVSMLTLGIVLACYVQVLFFNGKMTDASDGTFLSDVSDVLKIVNSVIFIEIMLFPPLAVIFSASKKKQAEKAEKQPENDDKTASQEKSLFAKNIVTIAFAGITLMQLTGFLTSYTKNDPDNYRSSKNDLLLFNYSNTTSFSKDNNIVVFLVDRFDSFWADNLLEEYPDIAESLDGFTFYRNNLSHYTHTFPSIPCTLTHNEFDDSEWYSFLDRVWQGDNALSDLKKNGYEVDLFISRNTTYNLPESVLPYCDNLETPDNVTFEVYNDKIRTMLMLLCGSRVVPYAFKDYCYTAITYLDEQSYYEYRYDNFGSYAPFTTSLKSDVKFYDFTQSAEFDADSPKKKFTFVHLFGAHDSNPELIEKTGVNTASNSLRQAVAANFESIKVYLENAKKLGVYDNTTFIILGDHGANPEKLSDLYTKMLVKPDVTALFIKPVGAEHGELKFDDIAALSNDMFSASILEYAGLDHSAYGDSYNDIITSGKTVTRSFKAYHWAGIGTTELAEEFEITGDARDFSNWKKIK